MTTHTLLIIIAIVLLGFVVVPVIGVFFLHRKYGPRVPGKVAVVMWVLSISYFSILLIYGKELVPDRYKMEPRQVYQCGWETIYVQKSKSKNY